MNTSSSIVYRIVPCDLGYLLLATTKQGICSLKIGDCADNLVKALADEFNQTRIIKDDDSNPEWLDKILDFIAGQKYSLDLPIDIQGTEFQKQVWQALQNISYGETRTYQEIAIAIGKPKAVRAIGSACGANPIALIIPCHRVVRSDGSLGGYHWGIERKQKLIERENQVLNIEHLEQKRKLKSYQVLPSI